MKILRNIVICLTVVGLLVLIGIGLEKTNHYTLNVKAVVVNEDKVIFKDEHGNVWGWTLEDGETYKKNERVILHMNINGTEECIHDDIIESIER